jgi:serine/threonine protein kinase
MYELGEELGHGAFAVVRRATNRLTGETVAVKVISKNKMSPDALLKLELEVEILKAVDHPHIISLKNFYQTEKFLYIVMECMSGGELFDRIVEKKTFSESDASGLLRNIIR